PHLHPLPTRRSSDLTAGSPGQICRAIDSVMTATGGAPFRFSSSVNNRPWMRRMRISEKNEGSTGLLLGTLVLENDPFHRSLPGTSNRKDVLDCMGMFWMSAVDST